ncbi:DUF433 domain-containing protein [Agriterribacter sp.]|uniref:DUF433 domain-containing protein n=1 Tax=Agriterribacter sp. TaxID=2821509 RepID=UPI002D05FB5F|nr:DUF433 domain-containing protein [Agriterribacter sp.]HTN06252.1 DUF433 domain-containing protein [Agriterribacter sp.]
MENLLSRITLNAEVCNGKPIIRNMRFTAAWLLELLAGRMNDDEILADYPYFEKDDIKTVLQYAAHMANAKTLLKAS